MFKPVHYALIASVAVLGLLAGTYYAGLRGGDDCGAGAVGGGMASVGGPFSLTDENGKAVTDKDVITGPTLVYFGYTFCPDICPTDVARNADAVDILEKQGDVVTPVFISVDPGRDTPAVLKEWTDFFGPRMIGLTGTKEQIDAAVKAYKTYYSIPEDTSGGDYLVDHMANTYLMVPGEGLLDFFTREDTAEEIAARTACLLSKQS